MEGVDRGNEMPIVGGWEGRGHAGDEWEFEERPKVNKNLSNNGVLG